MKELTLQERKDISLEILTELDKVCKRYHIPYFLAYGTLIGAVRHKGFIPWDDDIDVWVKLDDYDRLIKLLQKETEYEILNTGFDVNFPLMFTKVSDSKTSVERIEKKRGDFRRGIAVDIFPLADYPRNRIKRKWFSILLGINKAFSLKKMNGLDRKKTKDHAIEMACTLFSCIGMNETFWRSRINNFLLKIAPGDKLFSPFSPYGFKDVHDKCFFNTCVDLQFEGKVFNGPIGWDEILKKIYGDYMKLPPKEKQISNHDVKAFYLSK